MRKLTRRLILLLVLTLAVIAFTLPSQKIEAAPPAIDCDLIGALCRLTSAVDYEMCIMKGGAPDACAWAEAEQTIKCIKDAGCGPLPKSPPDN